MTNNSETPTYDALSTAEQENVNILSGIYNKIFSKVPDETSNQLENPIIELISTIPPERIVRMIDDHRKESADLPSGITGVDGVEVVDDKKNER